MTKLITYEEKVQAVSSLACGERMQKALTMAFGGNQAMALRFARILVSACQKSPKLLDCTTSSLVGAAFMCAEMGLVPDGRQGVLIPFKDKATFVPQYQGLNQLAYRSRLVAGIHTACVYEGEVFAYEVVDGFPTIKHKPDDTIQGAIDATKFLGAYAAVLIAGGGRVLEWMPKDRIAKIRARSAGANKPDSPWNHPEDWAWMARKTALRAALKQAPHSYELAKAMSADEAAESGRDQDLVIPVDFREAPEDLTTAADEMHADELREGFKQSPTPTAADEMWAKLSEAERKLPGVREAYERAGTGAA